MRVSPGVAGGVAGVLGIAIPSVGVAVLPIWQFPGTDASGADLVRFARDHRAALQLVMACNSVGVALWLVFGAVLWARLRAAGGSVLPACFAAGLIGFVTMLLAGFVAFDVLVYRPPDAGGAGGAVGAHLLYDLTFGLLAMSGLPTAIALGAYAALVWRAQAPGLPSATAVLAAVAAAAHLVLLLSFVVPSGFFSLQGQVITVIPAPLWAWILVTGIAMVRPDQPARTRV